MKDLVNIRAMVPEVPGITGDAALICPLCFHLAWYHDLHCLRFSPIYLRVCGCKNRALV